MDSDNGSSHSGKKTPEKSSPTVSKETSINKGINTENTVEDKFTESWSQRNLNKVKAESTGNTNGEKSVGRSSLNNFEKLEVDNIENTDEKLAGKRSSSNPTLKKEDIKMKGDEKPLESCSCSNLLEISNTKDNSEIISLERCFSGSCANIENKSNDQTNQSSSLITPMEFKQVLNTESTKVETSDRSESVLHREGASIPLTSLQDEALKGCVYDPNTVAKRSNFGSNKDLFESFNELPSTVRAFYSPAVAVAALQHVAGGEHRGSQNSDYDPGPGPTPDNSVREFELYETVSVDGDEVQDDIKCYEKLCCSEDGRVGRIFIFVCLGFLFCFAAIIIRYLDPSLYPFAFSFIVVGSIFFILFFYNLVKMLHTWWISDER